MDQRKKKQVYIFASIAVVIAAGLFLFLHNEKPEVEVIEEKPDSTALSIAVLPTTDCLPLYVADRCGIADSIGLNLHIVEYGSAMDADTAFMNHRVDGSVCDMVKISIWQNSGDSITPIIGGDLNLSLITSRQSRINNVRGLKEKIIGITRLSAINLYADKLISSLAKDTIEINTPQINNLVVRSQMVIQNQYDGAILPEPYASICVGHGGKRISNFREIEGMNGMFAIAFSDSVLSVRGGDIDKLKKAYNMSVDYINNRNIYMKDRFMSMLGFTDDVPDSVYKLPRMKHYVKPSEEALKTGRDWMK